MQEDKTKQQVQQAAEAEAAPEQKPISEAKKSALMRYMAIMFAVAFMLVLVSFLIQNHSSNEQITALSASTNDLISRAEKLQTQNRELEDENKELKEENAEMEKELKALREEKESTQQSVSELKETVETYEALTTALRCETHEGNLTYSKAMDTLKFNQKYLSEPAKELYRSLTEETTGE